jgi:ribosomal-protein-alanine N-acetyltransferase
VSISLPVEIAWKNLWPVALQELKERVPNPLAAAIPLSTWFCHQLEASGFRQIDQVIILLWSGENFPPEDHPPQIRIRKMDQKDIEAVVTVDRAAFNKLWQNSQSGLQAGLMESAVATVAENSSGIVGYQISTATSTGGHLARLAVLPQFQGQGIGYAIVHDMLAQFARRGAHNVSVNTQIGNLASLALYHKIGFQRTGEEYAVYQSKTD